MFVEMQMGLYRFTGLANADQTAFIEFGYENAGEYWSDRLSQPMKAAGFVNLLAKHLQYFKEESAGPIRMLEQALDLAQDMGENWLFDGPRHKSLMLKPLEASRWLLSLPMQRHLVPSTLSAFLIGDETIPVSANEATHQPRKRGRPPVVREQLVAVMRTTLAEGALTIEQLHRMKEKELESYFGASRDTLRGVRDTILQEFVGNAHSDNSSTNDK